MRYVSFILIFLAGCNLGPDYEYPCTQIPQEWKNESVEAGLEVASSEPLIDWWKLFDDGLLNALEEEAVEASPTLEQALWKVEEAWALAGVSRSDLFPQINFAPAYTTAGELIKLYQPPGNAFPNFPSTPYRIHQLYYSLPFNLNYEVDLWGRLRKEYQASRLSAEAAEEAYRAALLTLTSDVAASYFNLKMLSSLIEIYRETVANRQKALDLTRERFTKGLVSELDVTSSEVDLENNKVGLTEALRQQQVEINRLAMLVGKSAGEFDLTPPPLKEEPPQVPAGLPSTLLLSRPDLREAERERASQHARVGAAWAAYFPSFSLTGALGYLSPTTKDFIQWLSRTWEMGASMNEPIFDGGRRDSNFEAAWSRFKEADSSWRALVLTAFREVEDALNNVRLYKQKREHYLAAQTAADKSLALSTRRLNQGLVSRLETLDYQRSLLTAELNAASTLGEEYQAMIQLIKALGYVFESNP